jgi:Ankyrin repeats (3 copies)
MRTSGAFERKFVVPTKPLPSRPDLRQLKRQARELLRAQRAGTLDAAQRIREFHPRYRDAGDDTIAVAPLKLGDALLSIAREYGFASWPRLRAYVEGPLDKKLSRPHVERIEDPTFRRAVDLVDRGDADALRDYLASNPRLVGQRVEFEGGNYFTDPTLLEFIAENPARRGAMPPHALEVARALLDAGGKDDRRSVDSTLELVASSNVAREGHVQLALIGLLCDYGANPNAGINAALYYGEFESVEELLRRGAVLDLTIAAATGRYEDAVRLLSGAGAEERQRSFALAAQHGHAEILRLLLDAGEDPNRYSPIGGHSHATPLHQAALAGHEAVVRLLVERGARLDIEDIHHRATPLGWAEYGGQAAVAEYLRSRTAPQRPQVPLCKDS